MFRTIVSIVILAGVLQAIAATAGVAARQSTETIMLPAGIPGELLVQMEIPAEALPEGETAAMLAWFSWNENTTDFAPAGTFEKGVVVDVVTEGSYAPTSGGSLLVVRKDAAGPPEEFAAGEEAVLATGDTVAYLQNDTDWTFRNSAPDQPGLALEALIISTDPPALPVESVVDPEHVDDDPALHLEVLARTVPPAWRDGADGPLMLTIWRAELGPDEEIPAAAGGVIQLVAPAEGEAPELTVSEDGSAHNGGEDVVAVVGMTVEA